MTRTRLRRGQRRGLRHTKSLMIVSLALGPAAAEPVHLAALYPRDERRELTSSDFEKYKGAGMLWCHRADGVPQKAAAAWLIADRSIVMLNAHNFRDRKLGVTRSISDCYFQIAGRNYDFVPSSLVLGTATNAHSLHITDDWAILRLTQPADAAPQPLPEPHDLPIGEVAMPITMVSPAGHENYRGATSLEHCTIRRIDPPSEDGIRRVRHDCNDGYGGSGSGLFDEAGHLVAMQSASSVMNAKRAFDPEFHYGSALLIEGQLLTTLRTVAKI
jgi:Trypsin-like peptidase domain